MITPLTPINKALDFIGVWHLKICTSVNVVALLSYLITGPLFALGAILYATGWAGEPWVALLTYGVQISTVVFLASLMGFLLTFFWAICIFNDRPDIGAVLICITLVWAGWRLAGWIARKLF